MKNAKKKKADGKGNARKKTAIRAPQNSRRDEAIRKQQEQNLQDRIDSMDEALNGSKARAERTNTTAARFKEQRRKDGKRLSGGPLLEASVMEILTAYCSELVQFGISVTGEEKKKLEAGEGKPLYRIERNRFDDYMKGQDAVITDLYGGYGDTKRVMPIDITADLEKGETPLITIGSHTEKYRPAEGMPEARHLNDMQKGILRLKDADGWIMRFGVRIGNGNQGFDQPVIVASFERDTEYRGPRTSLNQMADALSENAYQNAGAIVGMVKNTQLAWENACAGKPYDKNLPILVPNETYLQQQGRLGNTGRGCRAAKIDFQADGSAAITPVWNENKKIYEPLTLLTDVPWMSKAGKATMKAVLSAPYELTDKDRSTAERIADFTARTDGQSIPLVACGVEGQEGAGTPIPVPSEDNDNDSRRPNALKALQRFLAEQYDAQQKAKTAEHPDAPDAP